MKRCRNPTCRQNDPSWLEQDNLSYSCISGVCSRCVITAPVASVMYIRLKTGTRKWHTTVQYIHRTQACHSLLPVRSFFSKGEEEPRRAVIEGFLMHLQRSPPRSKPSRADRWAQELRDSRPLMFHSSLQTRMASPGMSSCSLLRPHFTFSSSQSVNVTTLLVLSKPLLSSECSIV